MTEPERTLLSSITGRSPIVVPPRRRRYLTAAEKIAKDSRLSKKAKQEFRQACLAFYGRTYGERTYEWIQRGEHDFAFASEKLLGVPALGWQVAAWDALTDHRYIPARAPNAGGKTTGYTLIDMLAAFYRQWATPDWGTKEYRIIHLAPEATQAEELHRKGMAILEDRASEQMYRVPGGFEARPCLLTPFFDGTVKPDGLHPGFNVLGGSATITCRPSTFKAKGIDGTDPALFTWDELRHEKQFQFVLDTMVMPRFLRVSFGRLLMFFTSLGASVELLAAYARGLSNEPNDIDWFSITLEDLKLANPTISDETIARANRNISKRYLPMVMSGKPIQPENAKFSQASVEAAFIGTTEPPWLSDVVTIRTRVMERCVICISQKDKGDIVHFNGQRKHPIVSWVDPASSAAGADSIVATAWDLQPPSFPVRWAECVYIEELAPGTKVQRVAAHVAILSMVTHGTAGFDANSALGHNIIDELADFPDAVEILDGAEGKKHVEKELRDRLRTVDLAPYPDIAPIEHNTKALKDADIDYLSGLLDLEKLAIHFHLMTKGQMTNYVRKDTGIRQDFVMAQVGAAVLAKGEMPDMYEERSRRDRGGRVKHKEAGADDMYLGLGEVGDAYFELPSGVGDAFGALDAYAAEEGER